MTCSAGSFVPTRENDVPRFVDRSSLPDFVPTNTAAGVAPLGVAATAVTMSPLMVPDDCTHVVPSLSETKTAPVLSLTTTRPLWSGYSTVVTLPKVPTALQLVPPSTVRNSPVVDPAA